MLSETNCMKKLFPLICIFLLACDQEKGSDEMLNLMDQYLGGMEKYYRFNGNVLVAENGEIVLQKSYGYARFEDQRLLNDSSVFELASVSNQFPHFQPPAHYH